MLKRSNTRKVFTAVISSRNDAFKTQTIAEVRRRVSIFAHDRQNRFIPPCAPEMRSDCTRWSFHFKWKKRLNNIEFRWVFGLWERNSSVSLQQSGPEDCKSSIDLVTDVRLIYLSVTALRLSHNTHQSRNILRWSSLSFCLGEFSSFLLFSGFMLSCLSSLVVLPVTSCRAAPSPTRLLSPPPRTCPNQPGLSWSSNTCRPQMVSFLIHPRHLLHLFPTLFI